MSKNKKVSIVMHSIFYALAIALLIYATPRDLQITEKLSNPTSFFALIFAKVGELPSYIILPIVTPIIYYNLNLQKKALNILLKGLMVLICFVGWLVWNLKSTKILNEIPYLLYFSVVYALMGTICCFTLARLIDKDTMTKLFKFALFALIVFLVVLVLTRLMKMVWGRMRYRDMVKIGSTDGYTPWYKINGKRKDCTSFPSGHTSSAANLFIFIPLCRVFPKYKKFEKLFYLLATIFTVAVAVSRLFANAHFLSDVIVGGTLSYTVYWVSKIFFFKNDEYIYQNKLIDDRQFEVNVI